jgi:membrane fusion protein
MSNSPPNAMRKERSSLFRQEALDSKRDTWLGDILLTRPVTFAWLAAFFFIMALAALGYLVWGEYTKKARVSGYLVPDQGLIKLFVKQPGPVIALKVKEGQSVKKGDVLVVISNERNNAQGGTQAEIAKQLEIRKKSLESDKPKFEKIYGEQIASAAQRLAQLEKELAQISLASAAQEERIKISSRVVARNKQLTEEKFVSELVLQEKQADLLEQQNRLRELGRSRMVLERESITLKTELANYPLKLRNEIAALDRAIAEITGSGMENEARRQEYVLAPQDGLITALQIDVGKQAQPDRPLMSLIPEGTQLQADLYITSRSVGFVRVGNVARLQYQAFPYQKFGIQPGTVTKISRTAVPAQELPFPAAGSDIYYVVTIKPEKEFVMAYGKPEPLQTGMQVDADIWLDRSTLLEWIFEPLFSITGRMS